MDVNEQVATRFSKRFHIKKAYMNFESMLEDPAVDAVYVAVPHHLHRSMVTKALDAGKHVLCEKPIAISIPDGIAMAELADKKGLKLGINYMYRYDKNMYRMVNSVRSGNIGTPYYAIVQIPWFRKPSYFEKSPWHKKWETSGGGTLITQTSHAIDLMAWAMGKPATISGEIGTFRFGNIGLEVEDVGIGSVRFESGALGVILGSQATKPQKPDQIGFYGEKGSIECTYWYSFIARLHCRYVKRTSLKPPTRGLASITSSFRGFARWVLDGSPYLCTAWDALKPLYIVTALYESAKSGKKIHCTSLDWWR